MSPWTSLLASKHPLVPGDTGVDIITYQHNVHEMRVGSFTLVWQLHAAQTLYVYAP